MQTASETLIGYFFAPVMAQESIVRILLAIKRVMPTDSLEYRITEGGGICKVLEPARWLAQQVADDEVATLCNGNKTRYLGLRLVPLYRGDVPGGEQLVRVEVVVDWIPAFIERVFELTRSVGPALTSHWGVVSSRDANWMIRQQYIGDVSPPRRPGAPAYGWLHGYTNHPALPARLAWIGYWSAETCRMLGSMTADDPRCSLFHRISPCAGGGLAFELTAEPLDLTRPEHRAALDAAYDAFPMIHNARRMAGR